MNSQQAKQRFGIIGNDSKLERAIDVALQVAPTDISILVVGESGTGKENIPKIIHQNSKRKHNPYIAVNCGAIPEGTIDSELFGHEKGSFTGAHDSRKGYFEAADGGTIFLDEVGELPMASQARLLRVLENGEILKVGSSKAYTTDVRIIAATNVNLPQAVKEGKFREDLFYRLNTISINLPPLRDRGNDIHLLFRKFAADFADQYNTPPVKLTDDAVEILKNYNWPGNIRQLMNFVAQLSVMEEERKITSSRLQEQLPNISTSGLVKFEDKKKSDLSEREILYKVLFDMKRDLSELKKITFDLMQKEGNTEIMQSVNPRIFNENDENNFVLNQQNEPKTIEVEESLSLFEQEKRLVEKSLLKHKGKRKDAAAELGISERTLYRKLKEFGL
ncbi:MAG: sigma-54-dependent Fis family transcriptional regulator [Flavobacteriales bacterium]|jgi:transcriptional regulator with PAS, ATPase and Fis domain|nr:sigma-54-dependent Fis family transcriptional regulator [Flavobacteriales bacterium]MBT6650172.1 sigma-54-dependent Fis family transcriptional regulator [Flavobacteriales bacterium]MBT6965014.1 sigma-54-dependent Fis family transcriptional regulator [Flavobacteriales bacterium]